MLPPPNKRSLRVGLLAYLLLLLVPPLLKWRGLLPLGWAGATAFLWGPWLLVAVCTVVRFIARLARGSRQGR